jgi:hypothetical protein
LLYNEPIEQGASVNYLKRSLYACAILSVVYAGLILCLPGDQETIETYDLTTLKYRLLIMSIVLPYIAIWFAAFYGYAKLREYADAVKSTREGSAFLTISKGALWLALSLPVTSITSGVLTKLADRHPGFLASSEVISHYIAVVFAVIAFSYLSKGARLLMDTIKSKRPPFIVIRILTFGFMVLGASYCYVTFTNIVDGQNGAPYYLPPWILLLTLVVPYLFAWGQGLLATAELNTYKNAVAGLLYKKALRYISWGFLGAIFSSIVIQYITSVLGTKTNNLSLRVLLITLYLVLFVYAVAFVSIALGAKKLKRIEEI